MRAPRNTAPTAVQRAHDAKPLSAPTPLRRDAVQSPPSSAATLNQPNLTPKFHWNLNANALQFLNNDERAALYHLFRFYDSSYEGDAIPAIHCNRLIEILRDAELLASSISVDSLASNGPDANLSVPTIEKVFAQAVLGKLRAYLDSEDQPALTFQQFAGALLHCAMLRYPDLASPELAFRQLVDRVLSIQPRGGTLAPTSSGPRPASIVQHAQHAEILTWSVQDLHHAHPVPDDNYLQRPVFQDVITGLTHDKLVDHQLRDRLDQLYLIPEELACHFNAETRALVTEKFRTFDVFDKGVLPRDEIFTLLTSVAKKLEITDVYEVMAVLLAGDVADRRQHPRGSLVLTMASTVKEISLQKLMSALHECRRSRTASYLSSQQTNHGRKVGSNTGAAGQTTLKANESASAHTEATAGSKPDANKSVKAKQTKPKTNSTASPTKSPPKAAPKQTIKKKERRDHRPSNAPDATASASAALLRRMSKISTSSSSEVASSAAGQVHEEVSDTQSINSALLVREGSAHSLASSTSSSGVHHIPTASSTPTPTKPPTDWEDDDVPPPATSLTTTDSPLLTLRLFDRRTVSQSTNSSLDGAVCFTAQLFLSPSRIVTAQSVYFHANGGRHEVWDANTQTLSDRLTPEAAVRTLQRLVVDKQREGFDPIPLESQLQALDTLLQTIREASHPRYAAALQSPKRATTPSAIGAVDNTTPQQALKRCSLDRGATWVRQRSASDLLAALSDSLLQKNLKMKKRQSILGPPPDATQNQRPPTPAAEHDRPPTPSPPTVATPTLPEHQLMVKWGLVHRTSWVASLNEQSSNQQQSHQLRGSASTPTLRSPERQRPIQLDPIAR